MPHKQESVDPEFPMFLSTLTLLLALQSSPVQSPQLIGFFGLTQLLGDVKLRDELKLSAEQSAKVDGLLGEFTRKQRELIRKLIGVSQQQFPTRYKEIKDKLSEGLRDDLFRLLDAAQLRRFVEIQIQYNGVRAFAAQPIQDALKLTDHQKAEHRRFKQELDEASQQHVVDSNKDRAEARKNPGVGGEDWIARGMERNRRLEKQWQISFRKAYSVLTDEQKATWKQLTGEPFEGAEFGPYRYENLPAPRQPARRPMAIPIISGDAAVRRTGYRASAGA